MTDVNSSLDCLEKKEEIAYLKNKIKFLEEQLCEHKHRMKHHHSDVNKEKIPIFTRLENGEMQVRSWHDITDVYVCEKCGAMECKLRELPSGYSRLR